MKLAEAFPAWCLGIVVGFVGCLGMMSCSGKLKPEAPDPVILDLEARDGWTGQLVYLRNHSVVQGQHITVDIPGYLPRVENYSGVVHVWPGDVGYVQQLVYSNNLRLLRWTSKSVLISLDSSLRTSATTLAPTLTEATMATQLIFDFSTDNGQIKVSVDPDDLELRAGGLTAVTYLQLAGSSIVGARIVCRTAAGCLANNVLLHELGHALGLSHAGDGDSVMFPDGSYPGTFSIREQIALKMMYRHRRPGNLPPDTDPGPAGAGRQESIVVVRG